MKRSKLWLMGMAVALAFGLAGCSDDDKNNDGANNGSTYTPAADDMSKACSGDECNAKQVDADNQMTACDFVAAFDAMNAVYLGQVAANQVNPQTAFDRSILGLIHLIYNDNVQKLLPKLGFIATSGVVDFKPVWNMSNGFFDQVFDATHDYDEVWDKLPLRYAQEEVDYLDTIDRNLTFDEVLDVLVALKPELESLARSFEAAAATSGAISPSSKFGCGLNKFQMDTADLNMMAAILYAADAGIDLLAKYDFNFKIYDYFKTDQDIYDDNPLELDSCIVELDNSGAVISNECQDNYSKDYKTLECFDLQINRASSANISNGLVCFIPDNSNEYKNRQKMVDLLNSHLFKKASKSRTIAGLNGLSAFQNVASHLLNALNGSAKGKFFGFSALPAGAVAEIKDIASKVAGGSVNLSNYIHPSLSIDLAKLFTNVLYRTEDLRPHLLLWPDVEVDGPVDPIDYVVGDEVFLGQNVLNYITNIELMTSETYVFDIYFSSDSHYYDFIGVDFFIDDRYDATFSSSWDDFDLFGWLNPHEYFGTWEEDEARQAIPYPGY